MINSDAEKLEHFLRWLQVNRVELRDCEIKYCNSKKGFGIFSSNGDPQGIRLVVPLDLAITPMRVLQDPLLGAECRAMFEEGEVDDRFLLILFLTVERLRKSSSWKPYLDMLPTSFGNPLWFSENELCELKGTSLYRATELQKKALQSLYDGKVKKLVNKLLSLDGDSESEVCFEDFLWANSIFWARALNIPLPHSYVFPEVERKEMSLPDTKSYEGCEDDGVIINGQDSSERSKCTTKETVWVEGLVPGIDFCNHDLKAAATWEVDGDGSTTGIPSSMYLLSAEQSSVDIEREITISYGTKGNEELLYLYGFVMDNNPDDYLMVHFPVEAIQNDSFLDSKSQLLSAQKAEMRCLLSRNLLAHGFFPLNFSKKGEKNLSSIQAANFSWSGNRKMPTYLDKLVFPENFLTALRTVAMQENELLQVSSLLEELVGSEEDRQPTDAEVRAAVWEACGDSGALQLLVDLLQMKLMDLEESTGTIDSDTELLKNAKVVEDMDPKTEPGNYEREEEVMNRKRWNSIVYRRGQKELTNVFLKEADHALQLSLTESSTTKEVARFLD